MCVCVCVCVCVHRVCAQDVNFVSGTAILLAVLWLPSATAEPESTSKIIVFVSVSISQLTTPSFVC